MTRRWAPVGAILSLSLLSSCAEPDRRAADDPSPSPSVSAAQPPTDGAADLSELIAFGDPSRCAPTPRLERLLDGLLRPDPATDGFRLGEVAAEPRFSEALGAPQLSVEDRRHTAHLPVQGTWRGLPVSAIEVYALPESDHLGFRIRFSAPKPQVIARLNEAGFQLPPSGEKTIGEELPQTVMVSETSSGAELVCGT